MQTNIGHDLHLDERLEKRLGNRCCYCRGGHNHFFEVFCWASQSEARSRFATVQVMILVLLVSTLQPQYLDIFHDLLLLLLLVRLSRGTIIFA
jgi:hypothetical protein